MTQTNTTQNKEELIKEWKDQFRIVEGSRWTFPSEVRISWEALKELVDKTISEAKASQLNEIIEMIEGMKKTEEQSIADDDWDMNYTEAVNDVINKLKE